MLGTKLLSLVAGLALLTGYATLSARAEDGATAKKGGTVSGTVVDKDGAAVSGAKVGLLDPANLPERGAGRKKVKPAEQAAGDEKPKRPTPNFAATGETDADGKFTLTDVPAGEYVVVARLRGAGRAVERLTVAAGQEQTVKLTLTPPGEGRPAGEGKKKRDLPLP